METIRLTQFSPGAGCGCKIAPRVLEEILRGQSSGLVTKNLLVGHDEKDDAAVLDLGNGEAIVSTTDFFTPIVDDPYDYGRISATNALSDIFAMGGTPLMALSILGWPVEKLPAQIAGTVIQGARDVCIEHGIPLAGGHSIDIQDPVFGLAVTGILSPQNLKKNSTALPDCHLFLTKPLGIGLISTAEKKGLAKEEHRKEALNIMFASNKAGALFGRLNYIKAMTDVTGFGLAGHLLEMVEASGVDAVVSFSALPLLAGVEEYIRLNTIPGGTYRNFRSYGEKISEMTHEQKMILCDPQTSGGLLVAVEKGYEPAFREFCNQHKITSYEIGRTLAHKGKTVRIQILP